MQSNWTKGDEIKRESVAPWMWPFGHIQAVKTRPKSRFRGHLVKIRGVSHLSISLINTALFRGKSEQLGEEGSLE